MSSSASTTIPLEGTLQLQASALNSSGQPVSGVSVSWSSQNTNVAQVTLTGGLVTAVGEGTTQITASAGGRTGQISVTVFDPNPPTAPSNLQGTVVSNTRIDLTWTDNSNNEQSFRIERESGGGAAPGEEGPEGVPTRGEGEVEPVAVFAEVGVVGAGVTSFSDTELDPANLYRYRVRACNTNGCSAFTTEIERTTFPTLVIETAALPPGTVNVVYAANLTATGGSGTPTWSIAAGALPPELVLSAQGAITGNPSEAGTFNFTVRAQGGGQTVEKALSITISAVPLPLEVSTTSLPNGLVGVPYSEFLAATGGDGSSYTWSISGNLPTGLVLDGVTGQITGTPTAQGTFNFTARVTAGPETAERALSITIDAPTPVSIDNWYLRVGFVGSAYPAGIGIAASGGDGANYSYGVKSGTFPPGLLLGSTNGMITGIPGAAGTYFFEVEVTSGPVSASRVFALTVSTVPVGGFNFAIVNASGEMPSAAVRGALDDAVAQLEMAITSNFAPFTLPAAPLPEGNCQGHARKILPGETIEDFAIFVDIAFIDGPLNVIAQAGPCGFLNIGFSPPLVWMGSLVMDSADLATLDAGQLRGMLIHEIGHALGYGTFWNVLGHDLATGTGGEEDPDDPRYTGAAAVAAYGALGGVGDIPLENTGGSGTRDVHWRETTFGDEVLTGFISPAGTPMPFSAMSIRSFEDLGFTVNAAAADAYSLPTPGPPQVGGEGTPIELVNDRVLEPLYRILPDGRIEPVGVPPGAGGSPR